jgi:hypothetical protein
MPSVGSAKEGWVTPASGFGWQASPGLPGLPRRLVSPKLEERRRKLEERRRASNRFRKLRLGEPAANFDKFTNLRA